MKDNNYFLFKFYVLSHSFIPSAGTDLPILDKTTPLAKTTE